MFLTNIMWKGTVLITFVSEASPDLIKFTLQEYRDECKKQGKTVVMQEAIAYMRKTIGNQIDVVTQPSEIQLEEIV